MTRVLIAEDDPLVSSVIAATLEEMGYSVVGKAGDGMEAVELTRTLRPDVVLMDIRMPGMDGLEATGRIQKICPTPVVILTAEDKKEVVDQAGRVGAGAYLVKESRPEDMERAITIAIARFNDMMELRRLAADLQRQNEERDKLIIELREALAKVKTLSGLLPICASCKKIRDDKGYWRQLEQYLRDHSEAEFSHGLCPECAENLRRELRRGV